MSKLGLGSRTEASAWIRKGEVCIDGRVETDPLAWVDLDRQRITRSGHDSPRPATVTLALHKPKGHVTTRRDERGRKTVYDLLPQGLPWVFPAGRLDADSEGLLIFTNDSALAVRLTAPEHGIAKVYDVTVRGRPADDVIEQLRRGVTLSDGITRSAGLRILEERPRETIVEMVLTEGRNRQIRRMWTAVGHRVRRLVRVGVGAYRLGELPAGTVRELTDEEVESLLGALPRGRP